MISVMLQGLENKTRGQSMGSLSPFPGETEQEDRASDSGGGVFAQQGRLSLSVRKDLERGAS